MLPKSERLRKEKDIKKVLSKREIEARSPLLHLLAIRNQQPNPRLTVITSSKLGKAVKRNRMRRMIVNAYSKIRHKIAKNYDMVIIPKKTILNFKFDQVLGDLESSLKEAKII